MRTFLFLLTVATLAAHPLSMSTSDLMIDAKSAVLRLRLPSHEVAHLANPGHDVGRSFWLLVEGISIEPSSTLCRRTGESDLACELKFDLPRPDAGITLRCKLGDVIVANHVHVLRAERGSSTARAIFDESRTEWPLEFREKGDAFGWSRWSAATLSWTWLLVALALGVSVKDTRELVIVGGVVAMLLFSALIFTAPNGILAPRRFVEIAICASAGYAALESSFVARLWARAVALAVPAFLIGLMMSPSTPPQIGIALGAGVVVLLLLPAFGVLALARGSGGGKEAQISLACLCFGAAVALLV